jgi:formate dehydrogenase subunit delta
MNVENLVKMANQIADYFRSEPDHEAAIASVESHIKRFWDPRMRKAIVEHVGGGGEGLGDLAKAAIQRLSVPHAASGIQQGPSG